MDLEGLEKAEVNTTEIVTAIASETVGSVIVASEGAANTAKAINNLFRSNKTIANRIRAVNNEKGSPFGNLYYFTDKQVLDNFALDYEYQGYFVYDLNIRLSGTQREENVNRAIGFTAFVLTVAGAKANKGNEIYGKLGKITDITMSFVKRAKIEALTKIRDGSKFNVALGMDKAKGDPNYLSKFAAKTHGETGLPTIRVVDAQQFPNLVPGVSKADGTRDAILAMMKSSNGIHMNLDRLFNEAGDALTAKTLEKLKPALAAYPSSSFTLWELSQIVHTKDFLKKTTFYLDGKTVDASEVVKIFNKAKKEVLD